MVSEESHKSPKAADDDDMFKRLESNSILDSEFDIGKN